MIDTGIQHPDQTFMAENIEPRSNESGRTSDRVKDLASWRKGAQSFTEKGSWGHHAGGKRIEKSSEVQEETIKKRLVQQETVKKRGRKITSAGEKGKQEIKPERGKGGDVAKGRSEGRVKKCLEFKSK